ncbi:MAG TPA: ferrochelatase, partial [Candidatus Obscuribacterales bacterium]
MGYDAVLMLGFGGPASMKEVEPFITRVVRGRSVSPERIAQVLDQYRQIGGKSPFRKLTERQARALGAALAKKGRPVQVYVGLLFSPPFIDDVVAQMVADGVSRAVGIVMAPHRSEASFDRYVHAVGRALEKFADASVSVDFVGSWHRHPLFVEAVVERVRKALDRIAEASRQSTWVVFTAHSIPREMPGASQYAQHVRESAELVA